MSTRRKFLHSATLGSFGLVLAKKLAAAPAQVAVTGRPVVISTWDTGLAANKGAWEVLSRNGSALDAVEAGCASPSLLSTAA
ncbi:hypothetical protein ACQ86N_13155 [Puia sp. P3]|uniref:hypothetical protein n=1 Tax=Puia sp. P3 TaxID=3423952 RepID=UPI003D67F18A